MLSRGKEWIAVLFKRIVALLQICNAQSWSLPVDMHMFVLGTVFLAWLSSRGVRAWLGAILLSMLPVFVITFMRGGPPVFLFSPRTLQNGRLVPNMFDTYIPTHMRAIPHVVGMAAAALLKHLKVNILLQQPDCVFVIALENVIF